MTCIICNGDFQWQSWDGPAYTCDCGREIGVRYARGYEPGVIRQMQAEWAEWQQRTAKAIDTVEAES